MNMNQCLQKLKLEDKTQVRYTDDVLENCFVE